MAEIHPSSVIHPGAELADDVTIGPFCIIGDKVRLGPGCVLHGHVVLNGPSTFGANNEFFAGAAIGGKTQDLKYQGEPTFLEAGDNNVFRENTVIHRGTLPGTKTIIGNNNLFLNTCHLAHDCIVHNHVILSGFAGVAGHVEIGDYAIVGGFAAIHQFVRIGEHAMIGGVARIVQDVPPYTICEGHPAVVRGANVIGLKRRGFSDEDIAAIKFAYKKLFLHKNVIISQAIDELHRDERFGQNACIRRLTDFLVTSERGFLH